MTKAKAFRVQKKYLNDQLVDYIFVLKILCPQSTPIPKVPNVSSEDDLCNISLTADLSKDYENFIAKWLEPLLRRWH